ncbi:MAG: glutamate 5-kinase [Eubacterium sp.]|nr:glutamate 5-kinase [Eubacterium sp.]
MGEFEKKRIVVKVGTSTLTHAATGKSNIARIHKLVSVLSDLHNMGHEVILVSSGAIGIGWGKLGLRGKPTLARERQAAAAVGQGELMFMYDQMFSEYGVVVSQLLFTTDALKHEDGKQHLTDTFNQLIEFGAIPIVNENDSVSVEELFNGDNDRLSAYVAALTEADLLIMLTDTDGLYDANPAKDPAARLIETVDAITPEIEAAAGGAGKKGTGGFVTKIQAAKIATAAGIPVVIMNGQKPTNIYRVIDGENIGTKFLATE